MARPIRNLLLVILVLSVSQATFASTPQDPPDCPNLIIGTVKPRRISSSSPYNRRVGWRAATIASVAALSTVLGGIYYYETSPQVVQTEAVESKGPEQPSPNPRLDEANPNADQATTAPPDEAQTAKNTEAEVPSPVAEEVLTIEESAERELARASELDNRFNQLLDTRTGNNSSPDPGPLDLTPSETTALTRNKVPNLIYQEKPLVPQSAISAKGKRAQFSVKVETDGSVSDFQMKSGTGNPELDSSLEAAVKQWRFESPQQAILLENLEYEF